MAPETEALTPTAARSLVAEGRLSGRPWCVWCNSPAVDPLGHRGCARSLESSFWDACTGCLAGGIDFFGRSCTVCHGVGFFPVADDLAAEHAAVLGLVDGVNW